MTTDPWWTGLLDLPAEAYVDDPAVGAVRVADTDLPTLKGDDRPVAVVLTGGAGQVAGPAAYCDRAGLTLTGLTVTLRDVDDLAGNARRVVAAVDAARGEGSLAEETPVYVELPQADPSYGWLAAADEIAAAELRLGLRFARTPAPTAAAWIEAALDRETPFRATTAEIGRVRDLLVATLVAFDGETPAEDELARGRRWLVSVAADSADGLR
jgi:hypothetical protein